MKIIFNKEKLFYTENCIIQFPLEPKVILLNCRSQFFFTSPYPVPQNKTLYQKCTIVFVIKEMKMSVKTK